jgi:hypothetical protein
MVAVKGAQSADRLVEGGAGELALVLEVEQEIEDLARIEIRERVIRIMIGKLRCPAEVGFYGALAQTFDLDEAAVILIPRGGCECVIFFSLREQHDRSRPPFQPRRTKSPQSGSVQQAAS